MGVRNIEKSIFQFIWAYSKRDQFVLLVVTAALFPFLFLTLELPKRIINDAIGAQTSRIELLGFQIGQVYYLWLLCGLFLLSVLVHGLLKMRINTMKGVLAERLLRRLRYSLIARMLRFPKPYFRRTSQGELVAMITGETEPMGGLMGDALAQPVLQAGQMLTILLFLFLQSVWFGLAAIALIPVQAWLIPKLQRQINLMNKERIKEVRKLAALIGESAAGAGELRSHGGWRYRLAMVTQRLGVVFTIRFQIYQKKFFMKFINNFITQLTPFFFFSVGGYLVIQGAVSLGALVAALAAYKDLSAPWKELLTYYNQAQDMSLRWETVVEKFSPPGEVDEALMQGRPAEIPHLIDPLRFVDVSVTDEDGHAVLDQITFDVPKGALVAIEAPSDVDRQALSDVFTREVIPHGGQVLVGDQDIRTFHQATIAARIGHANSTPVLFQGSFGDNIMMGVRTDPGKLESDEEKKTIQEAIAAGNSGDSLNVDWTDSDISGAESEDQLQVWWLAIIEAIGSAGPLYSKSLDQIVDGHLDEDLSQQLVSIRPKVWQAVQEAGLDRHIYRFDPDVYNPALTVTSNLLFATLKEPMDQRALAEHSELFELLSDLGLEQELLTLSQNVIVLLNQIFGTDGTEHPLFRRLGLDPQLFEDSVQIVQGLGVGKLDGLSAPDKAMLMTLPAQISAEQIGPAFSNDMQRRIVEQRMNSQAKVQEALGETYVSLDETKIAPGLSVLENALFGKISDSAGARSDDVRRIVGTVLEDAGLKPAVIGLIYDLPLDLNGTNLPAVFAEPLALIRAAIRKPDILVLENILASYDHDVRVNVHRNLRKLLPDTSLVYISDSFQDPSLFDRYIEISRGRMVSQSTGEQAIDDSAANADLTRKVRALETTDLFSGLDRKQLQLLAFGAKWYDAQAGEVIFNKEDDPTDGAYMILSGTAELYKPMPDGGEEKIASVGQGTLVGELGLIRNVPRALSMRAETDVQALRLGAEEFLAVVENDAATAFRLLQVVAGYTTT